MGLRKIFDRLGDMLVPKEIAPYLGTAATMFAGPLGIPTALALGQLGSAKQNSGKLDPYSAFGTIASGAAYAKNNPANYGKFSGANVARGLGNFMTTEGAFADRLGAFTDSFQGLGSSINPNQDTFESNLKTRKTEIELKKETLANEVANGTKTLEQANEEFATYTKGLDAVVDPRDFGDKAANFLTSGAETAFPGFTTEVDGVPKFDFLKASRTIGAATTLGNMNTLKEELKKQKMKDKEEEQKVYREWFEQYERVTGQPYNQSPYPETFLKEKYADIYGAFATGGRVGYNMGGGIMSAPGVPDGMQLDGREGMFISQGVEEKADDVPAMLSKNEFVLTADAMAGLDKMNGGSGDPRAAAKEMYRIMDQLEAMA